MMHLPLLAYFLSLYCHAESASTLFMLKTVQGPSTSQWNFYYNSTLRFGHCLGYIFFPVNNCFGIIVISIQYYFKLGKILKLISNNNRWGSLLVNYLRKVSEIHFGTSKWVNIVDFFLSLPVVVNHYISLYCTT